MHTVTPRPAPRRGATSRRRLHATSESERRSASASRAPRRPSTSRTRASRPPSSWARRSAVSRSSARAVAARPNGSSRLRGSPPAASRSSARRTDAFSSSSSTMTCRPAKKQSIVHCSVGSPRSTERTQSRIVSCVTVVVLPQRSRERGAGECSNSVHVRRTTVKGAESPSDTPGYGWWTFALRARGVARRVGPARVRSRVRSGGERRSRRCRSPRRRAGRRRRSPRSSSPA